MEIEFDINILNESYIPAYNFRGRYLHLYGSAGSGKSVFAGQKLLLRTMTELEHRFLYYRKVAKTIRGSQFQLFKDIISRWDSLGLVTNYHLSDLFKINKSDMEIIYKPNENSLIPFGLDDVEKLKSITGITGTWGEEPTEIEEDEFKQVDLRMRGETQNYKQHIFSYNPINEDHWLKKKQDSINVNI
jgi:phage terminase large subunit